MTSTPRPDHTIEIAELQLAMLRELAELGMVASRAFSSSAVAAAEAEKTILADEYFMPEVGRARACGAKDAAESFQKVFRAVRLTLMLEMKVAIDLRDGPARAAAETPSVRFELQDPKHAAGPLTRDRDDDRDVTRLDAERLIDIERPDVLPLRVSLRETVDCLCGDLGATADWTGWRIAPPDWTQTRPPALTPATHPAGVADRCPPPTPPTTASPSAPGTVRSSAPPSTSG